jgi:hypothetical protein
MLECPSCQQMLPPTAHFCARCGAPLLATMASPSSIGIGDVGPQEAGSQPVHLSHEDISAQETLIQPGFSRRVGKVQESRQEPVLADGVQALAAPEYTHLKHELAEHCLEIIASMDSLLPFVYENHRAENQALFASTLEQRLPLEDPAWGRVAFVLGAYGNYMYRYTLSAEQKRKVWSALLWAVYYERCYRRKYLAQRCQQLLHFFQGCAEDSDFLSVAIGDLEKLSLYLETNSLKKMHELLQHLPQPPGELLQHIAAQMPRAEARKQERLALLQAQLVRKGRTGKAEKASSAALPGSLPMQGEQKSSPASRQEGSWQAKKPGVSDETSRAANGPEEDAFPPVLAAALPPAARKVLSFFTDEQCQDFFACLRAARLASINRLLQQVRRPLLVALCQELLAAGPLDNQAPRRPIRLGKKNADRFAEARRLLSSPRPHEQQIALRLFEQGARETTHPDYAPLAREWMLYARAVVQGSPRVIDEWESDVQRDIASWEECWNLALFYQQTGYPAEALRVLKPGLDARRAPVAHLRLALACALDLLLRPEAPGVPAQDFLLAHLESWPHPLSFLAWLALAYDERRPLHPRQQSLRLSTFQELLEHPITLPDPQKDLPEVRVAALEESLVERAHCEAAWLLWINDYAERHPRTYQVWARLAETSERLGRLEAAELALQHIVEIQYHNDYAHYQEGEPLPRAKYLRSNLEKLFEFYQRHNLFQQGQESFESCYPSLSHLWDAHDPANRRLIALTHRYLERRQRAEEEAARARSEISLRDLSRSTTLPLEPSNSGLRVGIFVDYENIARFIPREMDAEAVGKALVNYASQFGEVVCQWASASPHNLSNLADVRSGLEAAHFKVRFPRRELQFSVSKKNLADFALLECLSEAMINDSPDVYLIVSGDRDYYERICSLLDAGHIVRILAATDSQHLSSRYRELEQQRARERRAAGHEDLDFFIDDLGEILYPLVSLN